MIFEDNKRNRKQENKQPHAERTPRGIHRPKAEGAICQHTHDSIHLKKTRKEFPIEFHTHKSTAPLQQSNGKDHPQKNKKRKKTTNNIQ